MVWLSIPAEPRTVKYRVTSYSRAYVYLGRSRLPIRTIQKCSRHQRPCQPARVAARSGASRCRHRTTVRRESSPWARGLGPRAPATAPWLPHFESRASARSAGAPPPLPSCAPRAVPPRPMGHDIALCGARSPAAPGSCRSGSRRLFRKSVPPAGCLAVGQSQATPIHKRGGHGELSGGRRAGQRDGSRICAQRCPGNLYRRGGTTSGRVADARQLAQLRCALPRLSRQARALLAWPATHRSHLTLCARCLMCAPCRAGTGGRRLARCSGLCGDLGWRGRGLSNDLWRTTPLLMVPKLVAMTTPMHPLLIAHQPRPQPTISALCRPACVVCFIRNARLELEIDLFWVEIQTISYGNGPRRSIPLRAHAVADETRPNQHHNGSSTPRWASVTSITVRCLPFVRIVPELHFFEKLDPAGFFRGGGRFVVTDTAVVAHKNRLPILIGVPHMS